MVSLDVRAGMGRDSTFLVLFILEMADYLAEEAAVLVAQLLVRSHVGCPERCSEECRRLGKRTCVLRGGESKVNYGIGICAASTRSHSGLLQTHKPVHKLVHDSCKREVRL